MTSQYNRWRQHVFTLDIIQLYFFKNLQSYIYITLVVLETWRQCEEGGRVINLKPQKKLASKIKILLGLKNPKYVSMCILELGKVPMYKF